MPRAVKTMENLLYNYTSNVNETLLIITDAASRGQHNSPAEHMSLQNQRRWRGKFLLALWWERCATRGHCRYYVDNVSIWCTMYHYVLSTLWHNVDLIWLYLCMVYGIISLRVGAVWHCLVDTMGAGPGTAYHSLGNVGTISGHLWNYGNIFIYTETNETILELAKE